MGGMTLRYYAAEHRVRSAERFAQIIYLDKISPTAIVPVV